ncbi:pilus assembly protein TadG-related protein [Virgibacillus halophilus]|uniref:Pilus assembly protein TadG-related protein n=1 Tax=Tigheibacillus halophilus TaxID=361280 RepID=A0ABU5C6Z2_9BACI|nr:pilus assembly protein TadG-related protein [Virgibacillus halophilus]
MKKIKKLFFNDKGSVSIFAIIIILPIFVLNALLIDTLRIVTAERQMENAMDAALRSTFSHFKSNLADVGLFAYDGNSDDASSQFDQYLKKQFEGLSGFDNLSVPNGIKANATFDDERNLVDYDVFTHQVLESMKYQAPVQLGKDFTELLLGGKGVSDEDIDNAEKLVENYEEILDLMKKRNKKN